MVNCFTSTEMLLRKAQPRNQKCDDHDINVLAVQLLPVEQALQEAQLPALLQPPLPPLLLHHVSAFVV